MGDLFDPFVALASTAGKLVADAWTAAMLGLWNAGLWMLRLALNLLDFLLTPDLSEDGPGAWLYQVMFWIAGALLLVMALIQLGTAAIKRDGKSLACVAIGLGQFVVVWGGWLAYGVTLVAACGGLTRGLMQGLLKVNTWTAWQPWEPFNPADITDATVATVLGLMGLLLWIAAIGHFLVLLVRSAALMVLMATTPIAAAGLVSDTGRAWFWKSLRWFHAAALSPALMVLVLGVGVQFTTGVANGLTGVQGAIGTAVPGVVLICVSTVSPLALFKLLAFVDPATSSGASLRAGLSTIGGLQGVLGGTTSSGSNQAAATDPHGRSAGEDGAADTTTTRFASTIQAGAGALGPVGQLAARGLGAIASVGATGAAIGTDITNQAGIGHNTYPPDFSLAARRATYPGSPTAETPDPDDATDPGRRGDGSGGYPVADPDDGLWQVPDADAYAGTGPSTTTRPLPPASGTGGAGTGGAGAGGAAGGGAAAAGEVSVADAAVVIL